jgi:eukaryotic-like serine/threonine-protein kinase
MRCPGCQGSVETIRPNCPLCGADLHISVVPTDPIGTGGPSPSERTTLEMKPGQTPPGRPSPGARPPGGVLPHGRSPGRTPVPEGPENFPPGFLFAGRYTIVERCGEGGMGIVYKALDTTLDQDVALKLIQPALSRIPDFVERFKSEVRLTRQVSHPNICRVHDIGEAGGAFYLSMAWIQGETLRQLLRRAGRLEAQRGVLIASKIAAALEAAHERGIVHRDLKPENVMLDERGEVFVMDFGLARRSEDLAASGTGKAVGTPPYMAPEQARGEGIDARADLFALGLVVREMLTGRAPQIGVFHLPELLLDVPRAVRPVLRRLLAADPERRMGSAREAAEALRGIQKRLPPTGSGAGAWRLRWIGAGFGLALVLAGLWVGVGHQRGRGGTSGPSGKRSSVPAVYTASLAWPFYERGLAYLDGEDDSVRAVDSAIQMFQRGIDADPEFAPAWAGFGEASWVRYYLTGTAGSRDDAERGVGRALALGPALPEALYARAVGELVENDYMTAAFDLEHALAHRPDYARAWARLGTADKELGRYDSALAALRKAIDLDPGRADYWTRLGVFFESFEEYEEAMNAYRKATALRPGDRMAWNNLCAALLRAGRAGEAAETCRRSLAIEPRASAQSNLGTALFFQKDYAGAAAAYRKAAEQEPESSVHWTNLGEALEMLGQKQEARRAYGRAVPIARRRVEAKPLDPEAHRDLGLVCARAGEVACALEEGRRAWEMRPESAGMALTNAIIGSLLGRTDEALDWLDKSVRRGLGRAQIENEPALGPLRADPRYRAILERAS